MRKNRKFIELSENALTRHPLLQQSILIKQAEKADPNAVCLYPSVLQLYLLDSAGMLLRFRIIVYTHQLSASVYSPVNRLVNNNHSFRILRCR